VPPAVADSAKMQTLIIWIAYGLAGLFFVACVVAWYEHLGRAQRSDEEPDWESPLPKVLTIDVELDALAAEAQAEAVAGGDVGERRQALGGALSRMSNTSNTNNASNAGSARGNGFGDTAPMILPGGAAQPNPQRRQRDSAAAE